MTTGSDPSPLFGPPPSADPLFTGGSVLATRTGVAATAEQWSAGAGNLDLDELAVDLLDASLDRPGPLPEQMAGRRASMLMLAGRFHEALQALPDDVVLPPPDSEDLLRDHLVQATCRAALGEDAALVWLRQAAPMVSATDWAPYVAHCLLRVGDARGDAALTEASLGQLQRLGDRGRRIVPRLAADVVARRPRDRPTGPAGRGKLWGNARDHPGAVAVRTAAGDLRAAVDLLHGTAESFVSDPGPVLDTADRLHRGGDPAGAALLLHAVDRTNPHVARIEAALAAYVPPGARGRRRLRRTLLLATGAIAFLVSGVGGYPTLALVWAIAIGLVEIFAREPGLSRFDSGVLDEFTEKAGIKPFYLLPRRVSDETPVGHARPVLPLVLGLLALLVGILVYRPAVHAAESHGPGSGWITSPGLSCFLVWVLLFPLLVMWAASLVPGRRMGYAIPQLSGAQAECQCRRWGYVSGPFALGYLNAHLTAVATPPQLAPVLARYGPYPPTVAGCAVTGAAWLVLTLGPENGKILLRSPLGAFPDPQSTPTDDLPTGQYL